MRFLFLLSTTFTPNAVCDLYNYDSFQHDANAVACDSGLSLQLKSAALSAMKRMAGEALNDVPVLMSGAGHDAMAMSHLTKVCSL